MKIKYKAVVTGMIASGAWVHVTNVDFLDNLDHQELADAVESLRDVLYRASQKISSNPVMQLGGTIISVASFIAFNVKIAVEVEE